MQEKKVSPVFKVAKRLLKAVYPKMEAVGVENLPDEPVLIIGNHSQMNGPIVCELHFPIDRYTWCNAQMLDPRQVPAYAYRDFWSQKPKYTLWFYKLLSHAIAHFAAFILNNANTIGVHHDAKIISTFRQTMACLQAGASVVVFPECDEKYNNILYNFQNGFVEVARLYHKKTGHELSFVPLYIAPKLKRFFFGKPIRFCAANPAAEERERITAYLMQEITDIARSQPRHTVVPYRNIPRRLYPCNIPDEVNPDEKARR